MKRFYGFFSRCSGVCGAAALSAMLLTTPAQAGLELNEAVGECGPSEMSEEQRALVSAHESIAIDRALELIADLEARGADLAIVSRAANQRDRAFRIPGGSGTLEMKHGHAAFLYKSPTMDRWTVKHLLFDSCNNPTNSYLKRQGVARFFSYDVVHYDVLVKIPSPSLQAELIGLLDTDERLISVHNPVYNSISNPFDAAYQNSNGWILAVIARAHTGAASHREVVEALRRTGYVPLEAKMKFHEVAALTAGLGPPGVHINDKPGSQRNSGWIQFVSPESIVRYLDVIDPDSPPAYDFLHEEGSGVPSKQLRAARAKQAQ